VVINQENIWQPLQSKFGLGKRYSRNGLGKVGLGNAADVSAKSLPAKENGINTENKTKQKQKLSAF